MAYTQVQTELLLFKVYGTSTAICTVLASVHEPMYNASGAGQGPG